MCVVASERNHGGHFLQQTGVGQHRNAFAALPHSAAFIQTDKHQLVDFGGGDVKGVKRDVRGRANKSVLSPAAAAV